MIGSLGVYDPRRNAMKLTGGLRGCDRPAALAGLREAFGSSLVMENDVDAAALAERALGHGREVDHFAFVHIGTGIGMGLVLGGQLLRGLIAHVYPYEELALDAAVRGGRDRVCDALLAHPLVGQADQARCLTDRLIAENAKYLPWAPGDRR